MQTRQPAPEGHGVKPQYREQLKNSNEIATDKMRMLCIRQGCNRRQGAKGISRNSSKTTTDQLSSSGHGVCEYMGATHSSRHAVSDAQQFTQPAVAQLMRCGSYPLRVCYTGDEVYGSYPLVLQYKHPDQMFVSGSSDITSYFSPSSKSGRHQLEDFDYTSECTTHSAGTYSLPKAELLISTPALCCVHSITYFMPQ
ncbi:hypothetical protein F511_34043 [Dorcoceras hygrometricum]|uniref:Uncharacterized protein n=1 Tax=Dorcoceras hygrometricum TaxID=472368 RepID=A0A2Z7DDQ7_9LAMI|nr:hypothetical protein F511_34043 [Dorcoceras hygrometricum]